MDNLDQHFKRLEELESKGVSAEEVFEPKWPEGLEGETTYRVLCDDKGRNGGSWLQVVVAGDGDVHVMMQDWEHVPEGQPNPLPTIRVRTGNGGGNNWRTRQALLWLAEAIRRDMEETGIDPWNMP